jgi:hypothetical protein
MRNLFCTAAVLAEAEFTVSHIAAMIPDDNRAGSEFRVLEQRSAYATGFEWRESTQWRSHDPTAHPIK